MWFHSLFTGRGWVLEVFLVVLATLLFHYVVNIVYKRLYASLKQTENIWDDTLAKALHRPIGILVWIYGLSIAALVAGTKAQDLTLFKFITPIRKIGFLVVLVWFLVNFIKLIEEELVTPKPGKKPIDKTTVHAITQILIATVIITTTLVGLQMFNINISAVLAFGGIGGVGVALAAKDLLANFFGGLMIFLDRPFAVGDWIRSPDRNIEGTVEYIGWRLTRIRTFDKRPLYVPNGLFSTISVENPSRMHNRRIKTFIGLRYDDANKIEKILKDIEQMLKAHPEIDTTQTLMVNLVEFASSSLNFMIYTFTKTTDWVRFQAIQQDVFLKVIEIIEANGAECAFPTSTVHIPDGLELKNNVS